MSRRRPFVQCDVFSATPARGNALAVVLDGDDLDDATLRAFALWTNLAETTFVLPPTDPAADYRVRILTPRREMPFAGHPTLGTCAAWLHAGNTPREAGVVRQECGVGIVEIELGSEVPAFVAPPTRIETLSVDAFDAIADALALDRSHVVATARLDNGPVWQVVELASAADVLAVDSSRVRWPDFRPIGLIGRQSSGSDTDYEVRMLAPSSGMSEDPITGSLNAALAHWLAANGRLDADLVVAQGTSIGRDGRVYVSPDPHDASRVRIGGRTHILIEGTVVL
mgnify:CR=1 FL=1